MQKRKLIEVALPLEAINRESAREKSIRHGHPSTLHLWWARRPLAAARAVLFAQLVDDPSSHPDRFPTEEDQRSERERLHNIIERLVVWENIRDEKLLTEAHAEIMASCDGNPPPILDPFAGGGTIPLEAQRLGLEAHASDLNPVAVLINKALIEIPPMFRDQPPAFPGLADSEIRNWKGAEGLAADVRAYGQWMLDEARKRIGHLYPKATLADGSQATVIAWVWARTVACPNPACGIEMPLVSSWWLGKKRGKEAYVVPTIVGDPHHPSGRRVKFEIAHTNFVDQHGDSDGTVGRKGAVCIRCKAPASLDYVRKQGRKKQMSRQLMAVVAKGHRQRVYLAPTLEDESAAAVSPEGLLISGSIGYYPRDLKAPTYGLTEFVDLFTERQLTSLTALSDLVIEARSQMLQDGATPGYSDAITTYLAFGLSRTLNKNSSLCGWDSSTKMECVRGVFARQALPMVWDFGEANIFGGGAGDPAEDFAWIAKVLEHLVVGTQGTVTQADAAERRFSGAVVSTDPPYYGNIGYSDLSDFFYVWLRRTLRSVNPDLLSTLLVPKVEELVANTYRHGSKDNARNFFENGFRKVFARIRESAREDFPITVYYAYKQSESDGFGTSSAGWETILGAIIEAGWAVTSTWPSRSEMGNRMMASGMNSLASSIVLSLRPRSQEAQTIDRRGFIATLEAGLPDALRKLQQGRIAPVDLPQAAIGPGMEVFSRFARVVEADGSAMTVRSALARINEILDQVLAEQEGDFDDPTRFAIAWYRQHGYGTGVFGDADNLARARNTSVELMDRHGILTSRAGKVTLIRSADLSADYDPAEDLHISNWEALHHLARTLESLGIPAAGRVLASATRRLDGAIDADLVKELAFLLFSIAEKNGWSKDALSFNALAQSWPDIVSASREGDDFPNPQEVFDFDEEP